MYTRTRMHTRAGTNTHTHTHTYISCCICIYIYVCVCFPASSFEFWRCLVEAKFPWSNLKLKVGLAVSLLYQGRDARASRTDGNLGIPWVLLPWDSIFSKYVGSQQFQSSNDLMMDSAHSRPKRTGRNRGNRWMWEVTGRFHLYPSPAGHLTKPR